MLLRILRTATNGKRRLLSLGAIVVLGVLVPLLSGCHMVGRGTLESLPAYPEDAAGTPLTVLVYRHEAGDNWPPEGKLGLLVSGNIPAGLYHLSPLRLTAPGGGEAAAPSCADLNGERYRYVLVDADSPLTLHLESWAPWPFGAPRPMGVIQQWLTVDDLPAFWANPSWVLTLGPSGIAGDFTFPPYFRCGVITVVE